MGWIDILQKEIQAAITSGILIMTLNMGEKKTKTAMSLHADPEACYKTNRKKTNIDDDVVKLESYTYGGR